MIVNHLRICRTICSILFVCIFTFFGNAQDYFVHYTKLDGLPSNETYDIHQDINGLIWIATDHGITSFDGNDFKSYDITDGLPNNVVFEFFEQDDGTIWCTTITNELFYFHPSDPTFHLYEYNNKLRDLEKSNQRRLVVHKNGSIKFTFQLSSQVVSLSPKGQIKTIENDVYGKMSNYKYRHILKDETGYYYVRYELPNRNHPIVFTSEIIKTRLQIHESDSRVFISAQEGVSILKDTLQINQFLFENNRTLLNSGLVNDEYWAGHVQNGVSCYNGEGKLTRHLGDGFSGTVISKDNDGGYWVGTLGSGILYYPPNMIRYISDTRTMVVSHLSKHYPEALIFSNNAGKMFLLDKSEIAPLPINGVYPEPIAQSYSDGSNFINTTPIQGSRFKKYTNEEFLVRYSDARDKPPLLTYQFSITDPSFEIIIPEGLGRKGKRFDAEYLKNNIAVLKKNSIEIVDSNNVHLKSKNLEAELVEIDVYKDVVYCATKNKGLLILDENLNLIRTITMNDGLRSNHVNEVYFDKHILWIGTDRGLSRWDLSKSQFLIETASAANGLLEEEVLDMEVVEGIMYVGTASGLFYFDVKDWRQVIGKKTHVKLRKLSTLVNGAPKNNLLELSFDQNKIEVLFEFISFEQREYISFRYKLEGLDSKWRITKERRVIFESLPPGDYELIIQPMFNGVPREEFIHQKISILPAFYTTWWFFAAISICIITATWLFIRYRVIEYNRQLIQEILRYLMKRLKPKTQSFVVRSNGKNIRIESSEVLFAESNGNYLIIRTENEKIVIREKISKFTEIVPDPLEYIRVRRSVIVRKDKITGKNSELILIGKEEFKIGNTYLSNLDGIEL